MITEHRALLSLVRPTARHGVGRRVDGGGEAVSAGIAVLRQARGGSFATAGCRGRRDVGGAVGCDPTAQALLRFINVYLLGRTAHRFLADLRTRMYAHLQTLPMAYFNDRRRGDVLSVLATMRGASAPTFRRRWRAW